MQKVKPKKALGQHFLTDLSIADRIASTLDSFTGTPVVEVGPGMGVLTRFLLDKGHRIKVAEIDSESIDFLRANFSDLPANDILAEDFLKMNLDTVFPDDEKICVIGNYPYNISSQIFFHILDYRDRVQCISGMLQKEVAERMVAPPGSKARGILSVLLEAWYTGEYLFSVSEHVFNPPPKVKSGVIRLVRNDTTDLGCDEKIFKQVVKATFGQRRKTIRNSIKGLLAPGQPLTDSPLMALRPEQLSVAQFVELTNLLTTQRQ